MWFPWIALFGLFAIPTTFVYDVWDTLLRLNKANLIKITTDSFATCLLMDQKVFKIEILYSYFSMRYFCWIIIEWRKVGMCCSRIAQIDFHFLRPLYQPTPSKKKIISCCCTKKIFSKPNILKTFFNRWSSSTLLP